MVSNLVSAYFIFFFFYLGVMESEHGKKKFHYKNFIEMVPSER